MHASIPVGASFNAVNPRVDSQKQQVPPATTIQLFTVNGRPYLTPGEADRCAERFASFGTSAEIRVGQVLLDDLEILRTVPAVHTTSGPEPLPAVESSGGQTEFTVSPTTCGTTTSMTTSTTESVTVESVPPHNAGIPHSWNAPSGQPGATLQTLPESGLFSLEAWAATLNLSVETVGHLAHRYGIPTTDGNIDAANWWKTIATANTIFPVKSAAWRDLPIFGVVTVTNERWEPKNVRSVPPSVTSGLGMWLSAQWAMLFNGSEVARHRKQWACVTTRGTVVVLSGIRLSDRPADVGAFPASCVQGNLTFHAAEQMAIGANGPRMELARVPREWTIPVRLAHSVEQETIGGETC